MLSDALLDRLPKRIRRAYAGLHQRKLAVIAAVLNNTSDMAVG
jgi:hypothetical protein